MHTIANWLDRCRELALRFAASGMFPASWLYHVPRSTQCTKLPDGQLHLEIVSHCWNYSHLFVYQLQSLADNPPQHAAVTFTGYYAAEDRKTKELIQHFQAMPVKNVTWNFISLKKGELLRRAIGRNKAAKATQADWVWFTDCDLMFGEGSLDRLAEKLQNETAILVFPEMVHSTGLLKKDNPMLCQSDKCVELSELDNENFSPRTYAKATGPIQILRAEIARKYGYCEQIKSYQKPQTRWVKTYEDRAFRWLMGTHGKPLQVEGFLLIRHVEKGRYKSKTHFSKLRKLNRQLRDRLQAKNQT